MNKLIYILFVLSLPVFSFAQTEGSGTVFTYSSPEGNYIRVLGDGENFETVLNKTAYFEVERTSIFEKETKNAQKVGRMIKSRSISELKSLVGDKDGEEFLKSFNITSDASLSDFLEPNNSLDNYQLFHTYNIDFLRVTGTAILDENVERGETYTYSVTRVDKNGLRDFWGNNTVVTFGGNPLTEKIELKAGKITGMDSSVIFRWEPVLPPYEFTEPNEENLALVPLDSINNRREVEDFVIENYTPFFNNFIIYPDETKYVVYYRINDNQEWTASEKLIAGIDSTTGNALVIYEVPANLEDVIYTRVLPEDYARNSGSLSDEAIGVAVTNGQTVLIYSLNADDSTNSVVLSWDQLPKKPYYAGIELARSESNSEIEIIDILPTDASSYVDFDIFPPGTVFTYHIRPIFLPNQDLVQEIYATASATCTNYSRPMPPFNLEVEDLGKNPKLQWETIEDQTFYANYVFRGKSPDNLELLTNNVFENSFIDSSLNFSARSTYYYAVLTMNLTQDTSSFSNIISYNPSQAEVDIAQPTNINHSKINGDIFLEWFDEMPSDDFIYGYIIQKKNANDDGQYLPSHEDVLANAFFLDTTYVLGQSYLYRVASITTRGDTSEFSESIVVEFEKDTPEGIEEISLINLEDGIRISWASIDQDRILEYKVYKKDPDELEFTQITTVAKGDFEYLDTNVVRDGIYEYTVTIIETDKRESNIRTKKSLRRTVYN
jgi:hypothetical protein